jgi:hypothetical protein
MRSVRGFAAAAAASGLVAGAAHAATVIVPATTDIFLASQPGGSTATGFFGTDTAPANSPIQLLVSGGGVVTFAASGSTSVDGSCFAGADGGCYADESGFSPSPASGTYKGPADALIGVFLGPGVTDVASGLPSLDYTDPSNMALASQSPSLNQIFFIGDGLTGTGSGSVQQFIAPAGATRLFLAVDDSYGSSVGNLGWLSVDVSGADAVPEPSTWLMMILGIFAIGSAVRRRRVPLAG